MPCLAHFIPDTSLREYWTQHIMATNIHWTPTMCARQLLMTSPINCCGTCAPRFCTCSDPLVEVCVEPDGSMANGVVVSGGGGRLGWAEEGRGGARLPGTPQNWNLVHVAGWLILLAHLRKWTNSLVRLPLSIHSSQTGRRRNDYTPLITGISSSLTWQGRER